MDEFQVNMPDIQAAQEEFKGKIAALQASADAIDNIMRSLGAPGGADSIRGVQGMLDALERLEEDVASMPSDVGSDLGGIGGAGTVDDSHHGPGGDHGGGSGSGMGNQGSGNDSGKNNSGGNSGGGNNGGGNDSSGDNSSGGNSGDTGGMNPNSPESQTGGSAETPDGTAVDPATGEPIGPDLPPGEGETNGAAAGAAAGAGGVFGMPFAMGQQGQGDDEDEEEDEEEEAPEYVSNANAPLKKELDEKTAQLGSAQENMQTAQTALDEKQDRLSRLEAAFAANHDPKLADRINQLRAEVAELNTSLTNDTALVDSLKVEVDDLAKRYSYIDLPPGANLDKIQALEGGRTSQWILDATRNEDNSINCVNYVCNRMPIPGELPLNAHLWDDQATKFADELGIKIGDVPMEGAIIVMEPEHSYGHDVYGHVMYVEKVENGIVWVTDNNYPDKMVRLDHLTDELNGPYIKYLYCPWQVVV